MGYASWIWSAPIYGMLRIRANFSEKCLGHLGKSKQQEAIKMVLQAKLVPNKMASEWSSARRTCFLIFCCRLCPSDHSQDLGLNTNCRKLYYGGRGSSCKHQNTAIFKSEKDQNSDWRRPWTQCQNVRQGKKKTK